MWKHVSICICHYGCVLHLSIWISIVFLFAISFHIWLQFYSFKWNEFWQHIQLLQSTTKRDLTCVLTFPLMTYIKLQCLWKGIIALFVSQLINQTLIWFQLIGKTEHSPVVFLKWDFLSDLRIFNERIRDCFLLMFPIQLSIVFPSNKQVIFVLFFEFYSYSKLIIKKPGKMIKNYTMSTGVIT